MGRIALLFQMYEMPFGGQAVQSKINRKYFIFMGIIFVSYYFMGQFGNGQGVFPYKTFWQ